MSTIISPERTATEQPENIIPAQAARKHKNHFAGYVFFVLFAATLLNGLDASEFTGAAAYSPPPLHFS